MVKEKFKLIRLLDITDDSILDAYFREKINRLAQEIEDISREENTKKLNFGSSESYTEGINFYIDLHKSDLFADQVDVFNFNILSNNINLHTSNINRNSEAQVKQEEDNRNNNNEEGSQSNNENNKGGCYNRFSPSKKYIINYQYIEKYLIEQHFYKIFGANEVVQIKEFNNHKIRIILNLNKPTKLHTRHKKLKVSNKFPIRLRNFPKSSGNGIENLSNSSQNLNQPEYLNGLQQNAKKNFGWLYKKDYILNKFFISNENCNYGYSAIRERIRLDIYNLIFNIRNFDGVKLCNDIKSYIKMLDMEYYNEYLLSIIFVDSIFSLNFLKIDGTESTDYLHIQIISIDKKFIEPINNEITNYRCVGKF